MVTVLYQFNLVQFSFDNKNLKKKIRANFVSEIKFQISKL